MNRKSYPERVRSALFHAIKKTAANLDACVKVPGKDFSRKRKLPLQTMLLMLIGMGGGSLSKELYDWFGYTPSTATASAFVQQRNKIRSKAIEMIFNEFVASAMPTMTFRGYRLFAVDGSDLRLPSDPTNDFSLIRNMDGQKQYNLAHLNAMFDLMSKYYPHIAELSEDEVAKQAPFGAKWRLLAQVEVRCYILISNISGSVKVAPLQILQFPVILPHKFQDAEKFNLQFSDFSEITETADKLRWLRYQKGLRQRDVADYAGIYRSTYIHYEEYGKDFYSPKHMEKIAQLFEVPVERLLDDYNLFLRNGQGKQIKAIRMKLGLTQREYADRLGISLCNLKQWEQNRKQLFKSTWEKYFK